MDFPYFLLQCLWLMVPGIFANMAPVLTKGIFKWMALPVDMGKKWKGRRILGDHKTLRGFVMGILFSIIIVYFQKLLYAYPAFQKLSFIDYGAESALWVGFLIGFGVLFGDAVESFIKRRLDVKPGQSFFPWDQLDAAFGGVLFVTLFLGLSLWIMVTVVVMAPVLHIAIRHVAFWLGITKSKWD
ncbi:MAG: CDP-archaeol synthase [Nanoarchaeota archaeon]|nr:CDP-archaeol synthase [Nanoarchaeota archaeon]